MSFLPLVPNWRDPVSETLIFNTEIIESSNGREQRIAHRRKPRIRLEFNTLLPTDQPRKFLNVLGSTFGEEVTVIDPTKIAAQITGNYSLGATSLQLDRSIYAGTYAVAVGQKAYPININAVTVGTNIATLTPGYPLGVTLSGPVNLYRTRTGTLGQAKNVNQITDTVMTYDLTLDVSPETVENASAYSGPSYEGYPRLDIQPNWQRGVTLQFNTPVDEVDYANGVKHSFRKVMSGNFVQGMNFTLYNDAALNKLKALFIEAKGQQGQFLAPTFTPDMTLLSNVSATRKNITVAFEAEQYFDDLYWITFFKRDGSSFCRRVTNVSGATSSFVLTLDDFPPETGVAEDYIMLSQTRMARFASDSLKINYHSSAVSSLLHNIKTTMAFDLHVWNDLNIWSDEKVWRDFA